ARGGRSRPRNPSVGNVELGGGRFAVAREGRPRRPPRPGAHLEGRPGARLAGRASQPDVEPTLLPRLSGSVGQHLPRSSRLASVGRHAVHGGLHRGRDHGSLSQLADGHPRMRFGWLPFWAKRMDEQAVYVGGVAPLKHAPSEYLTSGRFFCSIERHEGEEMLNYVTRVLGDDVLMYASDYPHSECQFPNSVDNIAKWSSVKPETKRKLLWDNANRLYKQT